MSNKKAHFLGLLAIVTVVFVVEGCSERAQAPKPAAPAAVAVAPAAAPAAARSKEQAMAALMALPELGAWSAALEKSSGGKVRGALIEYDAQLKDVGGKNYYQFSFVENGGEAAHRWESFLVAVDGGAILVEDFATDKPLTLEQWRTQKRPLERTSAGPQSPL